MQVGTARQYCGLTGTLGWASGPWGAVPPGPYGGHPPYAWWSSPLCMVGLSLVHSALPARGVRCDPERWVASPLMGGGLPPNGGWHQPELVTAMGERCGGFGRNRPWADRFLATGATDQPTRAQSKAMPRPVGATSWHVVKAPSEVEGRSIVAPGSARGGAIRNTSSRNFQAGAYPGCRINNTATRVGHWWLKQHRHPRLTGGKLDATWSEAYSGCSLSLSHTAAISAAERLPLEMRTESTTPSNCSPPPKSSKKIASVGGERKAAVTVPNNAPSK